MGRTCGGIFDFDGKQERLEEVNLELENPELWNDPERATKINKEKSQLDGVIDVVVSLESTLEDASAMLELAVEAEDESLLADVQAELDNAEKRVADLEFRRMFSGEMDPNNCYLDIQSGSGGTEAQDWAEMLLRMYTRWRNRMASKLKLLKCLLVAWLVLNQQRLRLKGIYAFGWLRTEIGVHRLVRKSPFDSNNGRHTSFAAVFVSPEIDDNIEIDINPADLRIDTYRSSGAGGQHVNTTDSAVRITHEPSGVVVTCQNERSSMGIKRTAMKLLRAKLYELEMQKRMESQQAVEDGKSDVGWGSQIRSYVLDDSRIKDLRTGVETFNTGAVLDGDLDQFIEASLKAGL
ncbi:LOW QUALITY PROTEIN: peptide chain release factor 2 [Psychrobacter sp. JCM 18902]|nr:LOW QUALITY PROTEIN: peptide chain release factor 2 [Psychrobacter sp. JCM 18902]